LRIQAQVGLADLAPTILDLCGLEPLPDANGRSLAPSVRSGSEPEEHPLVGHVRSFEPPLNGQRGAKLSVRVPRWKYIRAAHDPDELYDLDADPEETRNVLASHGEKEAELAGILDAYLAEMPAPRPAPPLTDEERRALEALGYVP
jgi:choline-sulfatase